MGGRLQEAAEGVSEDVWLRAQDKCTPIIDPEYQPGDLYKADG